MREKLGKQKDKIVSVFKSMREHLKKFHEKISALYHKYLANQILQAALLAVLLNIVIESLGRKAIFGGFVYLFTQPLVFLINALIIFATLSLAWLFNRRFFAYSLISTIWLALGIVNGVILHLRMTPFTTADLSLLEAGIAILPNYFSNFQIGLMIIGIAILVMFFVFLFIKAPKRKQELKGFRKSFTSMIIVFFIAFGGLFGGVQTGIMATYFPNLWDAYLDYGTPYCFLNTWLNKGIGKPQGYSEDLVKSIFDEGELEKVTTDGDYPNIIFLQLESFIDPSEVKGLELSGDPVPYFRELKEKYSSGHLTVPSVGGGTANTEFEIMTGMTLKQFGPGEYPYKSVLSDRTCESMAYNMKDLGYSTHAMHNHRGAFYDRNTVFANLGYDTFTSLEYMNYVSKTPRNWSRDEVLTAEIFGALDSTETKDYIYAISVQGHGEYPRSKVLDNPEYVVNNMEDNPELAAAYEYYINQLHEMDDFLIDLTAELEDYDEDVALVLYGDHLPALEMEDEDMKSGSTFDTEYVIWTNYEMEKQDKDLKAYQLSAELQSRLGMSIGTMSIYHQNHQGDKGYFENMGILQYDMLYGKRYIYDQKNPFKKTSLKMGYKPIKVHEIVEIGGIYYIKGEGFTPFSKVSVGNEVLDTIYLGSTLLKLLEDPGVDDVSKLKVSQVEKNKEILSTTE